RRAASIRLRHAADRAHADFKGASSPLQTGFKPTSNKLQNDFKPARGQPVENTEKHPATAIISRKPSPHRANRS
ncbi:MAG TPA: hypothetical protein VGC35_02415, partial [Allosphingosinicella sp.]